MKWEDFQLFSTLNMPSCYELEQRNSLVMDAQRRITLSEKLENSGIKPNPEFLWLLSFINMAYVLDTFQFSNLDTQLLCPG